jgi:hypothetical protein
MLRHDAAGLLIRRAGFESLAAHPPKSAGHNPRDDGEHTFMEPRPRPVFCHPSAGRERLCLGPRWLLRTGSVAAILGSILAGVGNGAHPVTPRDDPEGVARVIADSDAWTLIHVIILVGIILMLIGIVAFRHSIEGGRAEALARLGAYTGIIGATIGLITLVLDGVAAKQLADAWTAAPEAQKSVTLGLVSTNETMNFALAGLLNMAFAGSLHLSRAGSGPEWHLPEMVRMDRSPRRCGVDRSGNLPDVHGQAHGGVAGPDHRRPHGHRHLDAGDGSHGGPQGR